MSGSSTLVRHAEALAVVRLGAGADIPEWASADETLLSVTATAAETSVVCAAASVPPKVLQSGPWTAFEVEGPLDLAATGVLAALLAPLAEAEVPIFTISTYDTDWVLVPADRADAAQAALEAAGHTVVVPEPDAEAGDEA